MQAVRGSSGRYYPRGCTVTYEISGIECSRMPDIGFRSTKRFEAVAYRLSVYCGISRELASKRVHALSTL